MRKFMLAASALAIVTSSGSIANAEGMFKEEIAKLPQDRVEGIRQLCGQQWAQNHNMRIFCEDQQHQALQSLITRGSI